MCLCGNLTAPTRLFSIYRLLSFFYLSIVCICLRHFELHKITDIHFICCSTLWLIVIENSKWSLWCRFSATCCRVRGANFEKLCALKSIKWLNHCAHTSSISCNCTLNLRTLIFKRNFLSRNFIECFAMKFQWHSCMNIIGIVAWYYAKRHQWTRISSIAAKLRNSRRFWLKVRMDFIAVCPFDIV